MNPVKEPLKSGTVEVLCGINIGTVIAAVLLVIPGFANDNYGETMGTIVGLSLVPLWVFIFIPATIAAIYGIISAMRPGPSHVIRRRIILSILTILINISIVSYLAISYLDYLNTINSYDPYKGSL